VHGGNDLQDIRRETGFDFDLLGKEPAETPHPTKQEQELLRGRVADAVAATYPAFAARLRENA
jgi:hypothetical protein